jgi:hypothetical protein
MSYVYFTLLAPPESPALRAQRTSLADAQSRAVRRHHHRPVHERLDRAQQPVDFAGR